MNGGSWARVLPAGDPGTDGTVTYPSPREGAAAFSFSIGLVGSSRNSYSDTLVFGGRDASGTYQNELWLLRAYNGSVTSSGQKWTGFSDGNLQTGVNANGAGVAVQYMSSCVAALTQTPTTTSGTSSAKPSGTTSPTSPSGTSPLTPSPVQYDTSLSHKLLAPLSVVLLLPAVILYRLSLPSVFSSQASHRPIGLVYSSALVALAAFGVGVAGLAFSFTSMTSTKSNSGLSKRALSDDVLKTAHGKAGLVLFIALYGLVPVLALLFVGWRSLSGPPAKGEEGKLARGRSRANSTDTAEKLNSYRTPGTPGQQSIGRSAAASPQPEVSPQRRRFHSWGGPGLFPGIRGREARTSTESATESEASEGPQRAFEVVNRPQRTRHHSTTGTLTLSDFSHQHRIPVAPRSLGDLSWLDRRRSVNAVVSTLPSVSPPQTRNRRVLPVSVNQGELDYALHQINNRTVPQTPVPTDMLSTQALMAGTPSVPPPHATMPPMAEVVLHTLFHALILALCILSLFALWDRAPKATFAVFLAWTIACYALLVWLAWTGRPRNSTLTVLLIRVRGEGQMPIATTTPSPSRPLSMAGTDQYPFPTDSRGPYLQQPPFRAAHEDDYYSNSHGGPGPSAEDDPGSEEDEQRRIEEEMDRRDVSIVTVPKRRLWIANPSTLHDV